MCVVVCVCVQIYPPPQKYIEHQDVATGSWDSPQQFATFVTVDFCLRFVFLFFLDTSRDGFIFCCIGSSNGGAGLLSCFVHFVSCRFEWVYVVFRS